MAREEKRYGFKPVEETAPVPEETVIRLDSADVTHLPKPVRSAPSPVTEDVSQRLNLPNRDEFETRTHQPGIEALIEQATVDPDHLEQNWGQDTAAQRRIPWGWFVLICLILIAGVVWSLSGVKDARVKAKEIQVETESVLVNDANEDAEAAKLVESIDAVCAKFFQAEDLDDLMKLVRHPDRVRPFMESYYKNQPVKANPVARSRILQPLTLDNRANFWMKSVDLADGSIRNMIVEIMDSGDPKIDWETLVCYQPMKWDDFATERPAGVSKDFRVYVQPDMFFSHEFADASQWESYRLTTLDSDETLFGYIKKDSELAKKLNETIQKNGGAPTSMILKLLVPEGIQSRRGVVIEEMLCPRWLYIVSPESGS